MPRCDEEFRRISPDTERQDTRHLDRDDDRQRETEGEIEVSRGAPEKRNDRRVPGGILMLETDGAEARQQSGPVGEQDEQEDSRNQRKEFPGKRPVLHDAIKDVDHTINSRFEQILCSTRHFFPGRQYFLRQYDQNMY